MTLQSFFSVSSTDRRYEEKSANNHWSWNSFKPNIIRQEEKLKCAVSLYESFGRLLKTFWTEDRSVGEIYLLRTRQEVLSSLWRTSVSYLPHCGRTFHARWWMWFVIYCRTRQMLQIVPRPSLSHCGVKSGERGGQTVGRCPRIRAERFEIWWNAAMLESHVPWTLMEQYYNDMGK